MLIVHYMPRIPVSDGYRLEMKIDADHAMPYTYATDYFWEKCSTSTLEEKQGWAYIAIELEDGHKGRRKWNVAHLTNINKKEIYVLLDVCERRKQHTQIMNLIATKQLEHEHGSAGAVKKPCFLLDIGGESGVPHTLNRVVNASAEGRDAEIFPAGFDKYGVNFNKAFVFKRVTSS